MKSILKFEKEASEWLEALPIGNGSLGGMVYGGIQSECVALNEESFWAGYPQDNHRPEILGYLEKARQCIKQNDDMQAQEIVEHHMLSKFTQPYQPLGTLRMEFAHTDKVIGYERTLNMNNGMVEVKYQTDTTEYTREYFCSYPSQVMAIKLSANGQENLDFSVAVDSLCKYHVEHLSGQELYMETKAPSEVRIKDVYEFPEDSEIVYDDRETIHGHMALTVVPVDGEAVQDDKGIRISGCKECFIYLTATTSYKEKDGKSWCIQLLEALLEKKYDEIKEEHVKDFSDLFERVSLELNPENEIAENRVTELLFQFGRYLLISSSRKGGLPANLQGIWNDKCIPAWWCNWTMNINLEMNYWPAYRCNLAECAEPLHQFIGRMAENGRKTAKVHYGCNGWTAHHMMDIWMDSTPIGFDDKPERDSASWAMWCFSGAWLCLHLWEHYQYTKDIKFLKEYAYPIMKGSAEFFMDWLVLEDGVYQTMPSTSPENIYIREDGKRCAVCKSSAMDMEIIGELLDCVESAGVLIGESEEFLNEVKNIKENLEPVKIGVKGNILEWGKEVEAEDPGHRHFSHLFSLYPGHRFTKEKNEALWNAARVSLEDRMSHGGGATGWSRVWAICLAARLGCGKEAYESVKLFQNEEIFSNFFGYCPPKYFQIDCNFGYTAAIAEMLMQTEDGVIKPIPAIPEEWKDGLVRGLVCEGGNVVDIKWTAGKVEYIRIQAAYTGTCRVMLNGEVKKIAQEAGKEYLLSM